MWVLETAHSISPNNNRLHQHMQACYIKCCQWEAAKHFDNIINTPSRDFCPYLTSDRKYFFYSSDGDVKFISIDQLPIGLKSVLKK